jgi:hypothetical protein
MGFIPLEQANLPNAPTNGVEKMTTTQANGDDFVSFDVASLASDTPRPTGMKEEVVLLSWLMVLLRNREDAQISYDWTYKHDADYVAPEPFNKLSMNEVMSGLQSNVGEVGTTIARNIATGSQAASNPASLILSTSSLLREPAETKDEVSV